ncbi:hypothetical protein DWX12_10295 [Bifidobacterium pseudocatenulatum]|nr:hypothetical protein DWX12_10295 [Bifidobacterium pseudocatenulatum]
MEMIVLADGTLKGLRPDPSWDVSGVRDMVGGIVAVAWFWRSVRSSWAASAWCPASCRTT